MEKGFDFGALLKKSNEQKHKSKPVQFVSVAGGVQRRLTSNMKQRRSNRLSIFDSIRNLEQPEPIDPAPISEARLKQEHRKQQLEKWKEEKQKKKKEALALKKKPFVTGVAHSSLTFAPPPPPPQPSTSGRVTRSQTARNIDLKQRAPSSRPGKGTQSFAPKNAPFRAPEIKNLIKLPVLAPPSRTKNKSVSSTVIFDPILPNVASKQARSRILVNRQTVTDIKKNNLCSKPQFESRSARGKFTTRTTKNPVQSSSSSSDIETSSNSVKRVSAKGIQTPINNLPVKVLVLQSSSSEKSSSDTEPLETTSTSRRVRHSSNKIKVTIQNQGESGSDKLNNDFETSLDEISIQNAFIESLPKKSNTEEIESESIVSSSEKFSSDSEVAFEKSPVISNNSQRKSLQHNTPKNRIPKSESNSEEKLRSPKSPLQSPLTPEQTEAAKISPCVTFSRGKDNARKEMKWKIDEGLLDDDVSDIESVDHFRRQLDSEITRLTQVCNTWDKISEQTQLPDSVQEALLAAVGQARLLMSQKMQQFASLVERCERPEPGFALVTPADLLGFWDMVFMQVENVDMRFKKLDEMRARGWLEEQPAEQPQQRVPRALAGRRAARPAAAAAAGPSRIRKMIAAARRARKEQDSQSTMSSPSSSSGPSEPDTDRAESKVFEAGFFTVRSPVRSPAAGAAPAFATPSGKPSLLKAVLSSEAQKASASKSSASFAMLRASILGKSVDCDGVAPLPLTPIMTPINLGATPARSILKSANMPSTSKSIKVVLFDDSDQDDAFLSRAAQGVTSASSEDTKSAKKSLFENQFDCENLLSTMDVDNNERETSEKPLSDRLDDDNNEEQKDTPEKFVLVRQDAVEISSPIFNSRRKANPIPNCIVMTRSRRKSLKNDVDGKSPEQALESDATLKYAEETKSHTRRKSKALENIVNTPTATPSQSGRKESVVGPVNAAEDEANVTVKTPKQSGRKKAKEAISVSTEEEVAAKTPRKSGRKKKALQEADVNATTEVGKAAKRSTRKKALDGEADVLKPMPKGSTRKRKTARKHSLDTEN